MSKIDPGLQDYYAFGSLVYVRSGKNKRRAAWYPARIGE